MKNPPLLSAFAFLISISCQAQHFSIGIQSGFATGIPDAQHHAYSTYRYSAATSNVVEELESVNSSMGMGVPVNLELGYTTKFGLSFAVAGGYSHGLGFNVIRKDIYDNGEDVYEHTFTGNYFHVSPTIGMLIRVKRIGLSLKAGPSVAFVNYKNEINASILANQNGRTDEHYWLRSYKGPVTIGAKVNFDVECFLKNERFSLLFGIGYTHLSFSPTSSELEVYQVNRRDNIESLSTNERYAEYENNQTINYPVDIDGNVDWNQNKDEPYQGYRWDVPFDNLAINIGFKVYFGKKAKETDNKKTPQ